MKIEKLKVNENKLDHNLKFYFFLKHLVKSKISDSKQQPLKLLETLVRDVANFEIRKSLLNDFLSLIKGKPKVETLEDIFLQIDNDFDVKLLAFSLKLCMIKDLLLQESKIKDIDNVCNLSKHHLLSLEYDKLSLKKPYTTRVNGALLSLLFFERIEDGNYNFMSEDAYNFLNDLSNDAKYFIQHGIEPNQIFMLMFSESINQSIISDAGSNYEGRMLEVLKNIGIPGDQIKKEHDAADSSTEYDFFFTLKGKTYGIGAKKTLRERYKQFIKTAITSDIDVMIQVTLGLDLNEEKAKIIDRHGAIIFVTDEIYFSRDYLQKMSFVHPVSSLTLENLIKLGESKNNDTVLKLKNEVDNKTQH